MIYDVIIVGGGIAGLYCAYSLSPHMNVLLLEGSERMGGRIHTYTDTRFGTIELGAGRFHDGHRLLLQLIHQLGLKHKIKTFSTGQQSYPPRVIQILQRIVYAVSTRTDASKGSHTPRTPRTEASKGSQTPREGRATAQQLPAKRATTTADIAQQLPPTAQQLGALSPTAHNDGRAKLVRELPLSSPESPKATRAARLQASLADPKGATEGSGSNCADARDDITVKYKYNTVFTNFYIYM